jgi:D-galactarolactone isomerase
MSQRLPSKPPRTKLPAGSCDCHMHAYSDSYPAPSDSPFRPVPGGDIETYMELRRLLGLTRALVVQPSAYGTDNRCTLDVVAKLGENGRAVVVVDETVVDSELERLTSAGARGLRFFMLPGGVLGWDKLDRMAARVASFGWHIQMQMWSGPLGVDADQAAVLTGGRVFPRGRCENSRAAEL